MKKLEDEIIYWRDGFGQTHTYRYEREAFIETGEPTLPARENPGQSIRPERAADGGTTESNQKPIRGLEKKDTSTTEPGTSII